MDNYINKLSLLYKEKKELLVSSTSVGSDISYFYKQTLQKPRLRILAKFNFGGFSI